MFTLVAESSATEVGAGRSRLASTSASDSLEAALDAREALLGRLRAAERRVQHLSSLLGESETENARLVQLAEVRRHRFQHDMYQVTSQIKLSKRCHAMGCKFMPH